MLVRESRVETGVYPVPIPILHQDCIPTNVRFSLTCQSHTELQMPVFGRTFLRPCIFRKSPNRRTSSHRHPYHTRIGQRNRYADLVGMQ